MSNKILLKKLILEKTWFQRHLLNIELKKKIVTKLMISLKKSKNYHDEFKELKPSYLMTVSI